MPARSIRAAAGLFRRGGQGSQSPYAPAPAGRCRDGRGARTATTRATAAAICFWPVRPHLGWRQITVTAHRTALDFAHALRALVDQTFPAAARIVLVTDNLNTHRPAALYQAFPAAEAWRILERLEWHYTPTHGCWLNMAELELSVLARQCLDRRIPDQATLEAEVAAWVAAAQCRAPDHRVALHQGGGAHALALALPMSRISRLHHVGVLTRRRRISSRPMSANNYESPCQL